MTKLYPLMPLRDIVIFPHMVAPLIVGRGRSIKALEYAMSNRTEIFLSTQLDSSVDDPKESDVAAVGTIANVLQLLRLPDGTIKALVEGKRRALIHKFVASPDYFNVCVDEFPDDPGISHQTTAYVREILTSFQEFAQARPEDRRPGG